MTRELSYSRIKSKLSVTLEVPHIESTLRILRNSRPIGAKREKTACIDLVPACWGISLGWLSVGEQPTTKTLTVFNVSPARRTKRLLSSKVLSNPNPD
jgi:hypothetical protein